MSPDDPRHGTYAGAQTHWREGGTPCDDCRKAVHRYQKRRKFDLARDQHRRVDATPAREHLAELNKGGMTDGAIGAASGISADSVQTIRSGVQRIILADTAAALLGVTLTPHPEGWVDATGTRRRIRALAAIGWGKREIVAAARNLGHPLTFSVVAYCDRELGDHVRIRTRDAVAAAYETLSMRLPEENRSTACVRTKAARKGYPPPLAWIDIDDPNEKPSAVRRHWHAGPNHNEVDHAVVTRLLSGERIKATRAEKEEALRRWVASGRPARQFTEMHRWHDGRYAQNEDAA